MYFVFLDTSFQWVDAEDLEQSQLEVNPVAYHEAWRKLCGCRYIMSYTYIHSLRLVFIIMLYKTDNFTIITGFIIFINVAQFSSFTGFVVYKGGFSLREKSGLPLDKIIL